jgi:hypothetical protein
LANHIGQVMAADFFVVPTATCRLLFVLVILAHERHGSSKQPVANPEFDEIQFLVGTGSNRVPVSDCLQAFCF